MKQILYFPKNYQHNYIFTHLYWQLNIFILIKRKDDLGGGYYLRPIHELFEIKEDEEEIIRIIVLIINTIEENELKELNEFREIQLLNTIAQKEQNRRDTDEDQEALIYILNLI